MPKNSFFHKIISFLVALNLFLLFSTTLLATISPHLKPIHSYFGALINRPWPSLAPSPTPNNSLAVKQTTIFQPTVQSSVQISEASLFQAVSDYRASHDRNSIVLEESLCVYARQRVVEHQERLKTLSEGESPLDSHAGFQRDAQSGLVFSQTGFNHVSEVLAYLPQAQTATQVLEWGWDTSAPHREGLLSNDSTHACIVGTHPFYVGILGSR